MRPSWLVLSSGELHYQDALIMSFLPHVTPSFSNGSSLYNLSNVTLFINIGHYTLQFYDPRHPFNNFSWTLQGD